MKMAAIDDAKVHHMKVTTAGQVSIPAEVRRRWGTTRVRITDEGGRLVVEPEPENPFEGLLGILAGPGPTYDEMQAEERAAERERDRRKWPQFADELGASEDDT
jgi:AbrB family looped-hinge helix DNA binding protein